MPITTSIEATVAHVEGSLARRRQQFTQKQVKPAAPPWQQAKLASTFTHPIVQQFKNGAAYGEAAGRTASLVVGDGLDPAARAKTQHQCRGIVPPLVDGIVAAGQTGVTGLGALVGTVGGTLTSPLVFARNLALGDKVTMSSWIEAAHDMVAKGAQATLGALIGLIGSAIELFGSALGGAAQVVGAGVGATLGGLVLGVPHALAASVAQVLGALGGVFHRNAAVVGEQASRVAKRTGAHARAGAERTGSALHRLGQDAGEYAHSAGAAISKGAHDAYDEAGKLAHGAKKAGHGVAANVDEAASKGAEQAGKAAEKAAAESHATAHDLDHAAGKHHRGAA